MVDDRPAESTDRVVDSTPQRPVNIETPPTSTEFNNAVFATRPTDAPSAGPLSSVLPSSAGDVLSPKGRSADCLIAPGASLRGQPAQYETPPGDAPAAPKAPNQEHVINLRVASTVGNDTQYKIEGNPAPVAQEPAATAGSDRESGPTPVSAADSAGSAQPNGTAWETAEQMPVAHEQSTKLETQLPQEQQSDQQQACDLRSAVAQTPESSQEQKQAAQNPHQNLFAMLFQTRRGA
jgi:hypothetical protein